jgi:hypothetical protein
MVKTPVAVEFVRTSNLLTVKRLIARGLREKSSLNWLIAVSSLIGFPRLKSRWKAWTTSLVLVHLQSSSLIDLKSIRCPKGVVVTDKLNSGTATLNVAGVRFIKPRDPRCGKYPCKSFWVLSPWRNVTYVDLPLRYYLSFCGRLC